MGKEGVVVVEEEEAGRGRHAPLWQYPCPEQSLGQLLGVEQSSPVHPTSHWHAASMQRPLPAQPAAHSGAVVSQSAPAKPGSHRQMPLRHSPLWWQLCAHGTTVAQSMPEKPGKHRHLPKRHAPCSGDVQSFWHGGCPCTCVQSAPPKPGSHRQWPSRQMPCEWHMPGHGVRSKQSSPSYPASQKHLPCRQTPRPEQKCGHAFGLAQSSPQ